MTSLYDFSKHIRSLASNKKYKEALDYFKTNKVQFDDVEIARNEYLVSDILSSLRRANYVDAGFQFLQAYGIEINEETKERILTAYGWLLWSKYKLENSDATASDEQNYLFDDDDDSIPYEHVNYTKNDLVAKIEILISLLTSRKSDFCRTLSSNLFTVVLKTEKSKPTPSWQLINYFCDHFEPEQLSRECSTIQVKRKGQLRDMELASDFESWYAYKTKALSKLGKWQECFDRSKEALNVLDNFHYSNDVWFLRRIALSKKNLGNSEDAIAELEGILNRKKEWFIQKELAELYFEYGDLESAYKHSLDAINNFGPFEYKIDLLYLMGEIFQSKGEANLSLKHFILSKIIRQKEGWKIPQKLIDRLKMFDEQDVQSINTKNLDSDLKKYWQSLVPKKQVSGKTELLQGIIMRLLNDNERGKDGFLKCDSNEYYFTSSANFNLTPQINVNSKVMFEVVPSRDGKRSIARIKKVEN